MTEARALRLCTKGDYIKCGERDDKSPLKGGGFAHVTHFYMRHCGLRNNSPRHSVSCYQQMRARRTLLIAPTALEATHAKA